MEVKDDENEKLREETEKTKKEIEKLKRELGETKAKKNDYKVTLLNGCLILKNEKLRKNTKTLLSGSVAT